MKKHRGITLIEVVLAVALVGIVIGLGTNFFIFGNRVQKVSAEEADIQATTRLIAEHINNIVRMATKTHTIPRSSFQHSEDGVRDPNTSYIGITKGGNVVIDEPGGEGQPRNVRYLAKKKDGIDYEIVFNKAGDNVMEYSIVISKGGKVVNSITSKVEVLNSLNIDYLGTPSDPAVALAYSLVDPGSQEWIEMSPDAYITLVLDQSGSMAWDMDGKDDTTNQKRIDILKEKAFKMIDRLAAMDFNIYVSLVGFGTNANDPGAFRNLNVESEKELTISDINGLRANLGNTNTGDGVRRAYYRLKNQADALVGSGKQLSDITQHMMILVDGGTNRETRTGTSGTNLYMNDGNITNNNWIKAPQTSRQVFVGVERRCILGFICWDEDIYETVYDNRYVKKIGDEKIKPYKYTLEGEQKQAINTFVIGFSNREIDYSSLDDIGSAVNAKEFEHADGMKPYILAKDADELDFAFEQFETEVENNLWLITRPKLLP